VAETTSDPTASTSSAPDGAAGATGSTSTGARTRPAPTSEQVAETVQMVKAYAIQETLDPVRIAGRWVAFGLLGAVLIGLATGMLSLGLMRMVQTEWPGTFGGRWMKLLPYLFGLLLCGLVAGLAARRINKDPLNKEKR
jgi:hypothetical protein